MTGFYYGASPLALANQINARLEYEQKRQIGAMNGAGLNADFSRLGVTRRRMASRTCAYCGGHACVPGRCGSCGAPTIKADQ